jgi:hypothetical protein
VQIAKLAPDPDYGALETPKIKDTWSRFLTCSRQRCSSAHEFLLPEIHEGGNQSPGATSFDSKGLILENGRKSRG